MKINPFAQQDIDELKLKIQAFENGEIHEERFKHYRLTRGVYGQRQVGVQMFRTKIPFGRLNTTQLLRLADVSERFTNGNLHLTTRQNIQLHHIKLDDTPAIWEALAEVGVTARGACGNTVRNITASAKAGIDPLEPFDVAPYVEASFQYFLRNPICQEMGRKIKIAFSSNEQDTAFAYFHDFGFIPRIQDGKRGFKLLVGGGLGAQSMTAKTVSEFIPEEDILPFMEASIRIFDRYGEREKRQKARMKFLIKKLGLDTFLELVQEELKALSKEKISIDYNLVQQPKHNPKTAILQQVTHQYQIDNPTYETWLKTNTFQQKQAGFYGVYVKIKLGDIHANKTRKLVEVIRDYAADEVRLTVDQNILLKFVPGNALYPIFLALNKIGLADTGYGSIADVTACPGTTTCNLGVTNSTGISSALEELVRAEYPHLLYRNDLNIKISGCMNSCGQHMAAAIGFHGSSIRSKDKRVAPALQLVLGGGVDQNQGLMAEKVIKVPTRRAPQALRIILNDFEKHADLEQSFHVYFQQRGKRYFYDLLKPLANQALRTVDFIDWESGSAYVRAIGVGECAGVSYDMVSAILKDAEEKLNLAQNALKENALVDALYQAYGSIVIAAKALLLAKDVKCNTHIGIINDFEQHYIQNNDFQLNKNVNFTTYVLDFKKQTPDLALANSYLNDAQDFLNKVLNKRKEQIGADDQTLVISEYYKA
ncbi:MAG: HEPN domain-containing protein [Saprospiraceae bacterium]|nr:HEPN domain-containing protein [Saprospiraceae bacterium]